MKALARVGVFCVALHLSGAAAADLIINEVVDGDLPGGLPKWVELRNTGATSVDITTFAFANYNNGGTTPGGGASTPLTGGAIAPGGYYILLYQAASTMTTFSSVYGSQPDFFMGGAFVNGDDVLSLQDLGGTTVDEYGERGVDGTGEVWEYTDGYSYRCGTTANGGAWNSSDWVFGGVKSLEDEVGGNPAKKALLLTLTSLRAQTTFISAGADNYCTAGTSASGCTATLSSVGSASSIATSGFVVSATGVEGGMNGLFFFSQGGRQANPWYGGTSFQCVAPPVSRGGVLTGMGTPGTCEGCFSQDLNARWCATCPKPFQVPAMGFKLQVQLWYRDPANTAGTTGLSDALEVDVN